MSEWWTYRPSDFLMYSPRSWGRLLEGLHQDLWPAQIFVFLLAATALTRTWRRPRETAPQVCGLLALAWAWIAWDFFWNRLAQISTGAPWMAATAAFQAVLLGVVASSEPDAEVRRGAHLTGVAIASAALIAWPLVSVLRGTGWTQSELPGLTPDATALFTIGLLLALPFRHRAWLLVVPSALLVVGLTMQWLLHAR